MSNSAEKLPVFMENPFQSRPDELEYLETKHKHPSRGCMLNCGGYGDDGCCLGDSGSLGERTGVNVLGSWMCPVASRGSHRRTGHWYLTVYNLIPRCSSDLKSRHDLCPALPPVAILLSSDPASPHPMSHFLLSASRLCPGLRISPGGVPQP